MIFPVTVMAQDDDVIRIQLKPSKEAKINSPVTGKINKVYYKDGETVKKGKTLVSFDCREQKAQRDQINARVQRQKKLLGATQELYNLGSASETDLNVLKDELSEARAGYNVANIMTQKCGIYAPFSGIISNMFQQSHSSVKEGDPVLELIATGTQTIEMIIPSRWMRWVKKGTPFTVSIDETGTSHDAKITRLGGKVDPVTQSIKAYGALIGDTDGLLTGMSGNAIFESPNDTIEQ